MAYGNATGVNYSGLSEGNILSLPLDTSTKLYKGCAVFTTAGVANEGLVAGDIFMGVAMETADTAADDVNINVLTEGVYTFTGSGLTAASVGGKAYINFAANNSAIVVNPTFTVGQLQAYIGIVTEVISATRAKVKFVGATDANVVVATPAG